MNDKGDRNDKESEKSPMRVIDRGLWKSCHCCHSCHKGGMSAAILNQLLLVFEFSEDCEFENNTLSQDGLSSQPKLLRVPAVNPATYCHPDSHRHSYPTQHTVPFE